MVQILENKYKEVLLIAGAMVQGIVLMAGIFFYMLSKQEVAQTSSPSPMLTIIAYVAPVMALAASFVAKQKMLEKNDSAAKRTEEEKFAVLLKTFFVTMAVLEAGVLFGFVIAFVTKNAFSLFVPALCAAIGFYAHFPRKSQWQRWIEEN
jgi:hypothetical protein